MSIELLLAAALVSGTPILLAALGELLSERAGVLNLGVEGTMLIGAVSGFAAASTTASVWAGVLGALLAGAVFGLAFAALVVSLRLNQIVTGLAFTILGTGLSAFIGKPLIGVPPGATVPRLELGPLADLPFLGPVLFRQDALVYAAIGLTALIALYIRRTRPGLILRALGESPDVVDALGLAGRSAALPLRHRRQRARRARRRLSLARLHAGLDREHDGGPRLDRDRAGDLRDLAALVGAGRRAAVRHRSMRCAFACRSAAIRSSTRISSTCYPTSQPWWSWPWSAAP